MITHRSLINDTSFLRDYPDMTQTTVQAICHSAAIQPLKWAPKPTSGWIELSPILMGIVAECRPLVTVELGSNDGVSICSVNQVIKPYNAGILDSSKHQRSFSVDPDEHLRPAGSPAAKFRVEMGKYFTGEYGKFGSVISFDTEQARYYIPDECANLFLLNLSRPYDELRKIYDRWISKIDPKAILVIYGTQGRTEVTAGLQKLYAELSAIMPSFELTNGEGLGLIDLGGNPAESPIAELLSAPEEVKQAVRNHFAVVGQRMLQATGHAPA